MILIVATVIAAVLCAVAVVACPSPNLKVVFAAEGVLYLAAAIYLRASRR